MSQLNRNSVTCASYICMGAWVALSLISKSHLSVHPLAIESLEHSNWILSSGRFRTASQLLARRNIRALLTFAYLTGWRTLSEILTLQWHQIDFSAGIVRLEPGTTKNDEARVFPFSVLPELALFLKSNAT